MSEDPIRMVNESVIGAVVEQLKRERREIDALIRALVDSPRFMDEVRLNSLDLKKAE